MNEKSDDKILFEAMDAAQEAFDEVLIDNNRDITQFDIEIKGAILDAENNPYSGFVIPFSSKAHSWFEEEDNK